MKYQCNLGNDTYTGLVELLNFKPTPSLALRYIGVHIIITLLLG